MKPVCCLCVQDIVLEFRGVTCVIGDAVAAGMRELRPGDTETKRAFYCAQRCVDLIYELTKRCASAQCCLYPCCTQGRTFE